MCNKKFTTLADLAMFPNSLLRLAKSTENLTPWGLLATFTDSESEAFTENLQEPR